MLKKMKLITRIVSIVLILAIVLSVSQTQVRADGLFEELFGISFYYFHYRDENGSKVEESSFSWGSDDKEKNGIKIEKTGINTIKVFIDADSNTSYQKCKPVLMWVRKGDGVMDMTKYTDINQWYLNKLEETFLLCTIPDYTQDCEIEIDVPIKLNLGLGGLLYGGYYEIDFYGEDAIPRQLEFAYKAQSYTIEELEEYIKYDMSNSVAEYYNADSGFRSNINGFSFRNSDYSGGEGVCAGISAVTTAKYNGYDLVTSYKANDKKYTASEDYTWYKNIYGDSSIHEITLDNERFIKNNSPSLNLNQDGTANAYPLEDFLDITENDEAFYSLLKYYLIENNKAALLKGNSMIKGIKLSNLENRWSIIDYVASYLRQGKAVTVNISKSEGGHAIVGYKMEQIDEDTFRLYCYDNNFPDDMRLYYKRGSDKNNNLAENGAYENMIWGNTEVYIDFTKKTIVGQNSLTSQKEFEVFEFDSSHTSINANSSNALITFSLCQGDKVGVFNYGSRANEIIAYRAFPVILSDNSVQIRTFAYYKSGEVTEVTNSVNTTVKMDYDFIGWYKIKDSKVTLTKKGYKFANNGNKYIECVVTYDNHTDSYGSIRVRIPIA